MTRSKRMILLSSLCFSILSSVTIFAKEVTLEDLINSMKSTGYSKQTSDMNEEQIDIQEKAIDLDGKNKIILTSNASIYSNNDYGQSTITTEVTYDIFKYQNYVYYDT